MDELELGSWNAACGKCGRKFKASEMIKEGVGIGLSNMYVCQKCYRIRQPQDSVRGMPDNQRIPWTQPQTDTYILTDGIITERSDETAIGEEFILTELGMILFTET